MKNKNTKSGLTTQAHRRGPRAAPNPPKSGRPRSVQRMVRRLLNDLHAISLSMDNCLVSADCENYKIPTNLLVPMTGLRNVIDSLTLDDMKQLVKSQPAQ